MSKGAKAGVVPKLRFPEFRGAPDWKTTPLGEASEPVEERVGERKLTPVSISAGIGFVRQSEKFGRDISGNQYQLYTLVKDGDFVYNKGNSLKFPQGCVYQLQGWGQVAAPNVFISFRLKPGYSDRFFQYCFEQNIHGLQLRKSITSGARSNGLLNISKDTFYAVQLPTPELPEQQKIAECLASLDALIGFEKERLEALKAFKKGLMQQLFPREGERVPRLRFPEFRGSGEWEEAPIEQKCQSFSGGTPSTSQKEFYGGEIPFIRSAEIGRKATELFLTELGLANSSAKLVQKGDVLVALYGANSGDVAISEIDGAINQAILCLKAGDNGSFLYQYLCLKKQWIVDTYIQGGQGNLSGEIVKSIILKFPEQGEQYRVASCLSSVDAMINGHADWVDSLLTQKQSLMQQLFPSAVEA